MKHCLGQFYRDADILLSVVPGKTVLFFEQLEG